MSPPSMAAKLAARRLAAAAARRHRRTDTVTVFVTGRLTCSFVEAPPAPKATVAELLRDRSCWGDLAAVAIMPVIAILVGGKPS